VAPHQLRHTHAVELLHEGIPLPLIQRQLRHSHLSTTGTYLQASTARRSSPRSMRGARITPAPASLCRHAAGAHAPALPHHPAHLLVRQAAAER
jgi:integrase